MRRYVPTTEANGGDDHSTHWLSVGDLMSGLMLFFVLLFVSVLLRLQERAESETELRKVIIGEVIGELKANNVEVDIDVETGDLSIKEAILFAEGSAALKPKGRAFLREFIPLYTRVLFGKEEVSKHISHVEIEGRTSSKGSYRYNMELSLQRANSVSQYVLSDGLKFRYKDTFRKKMMATGLGKTSANLKQDDPKDRKVVFRMAFTKDKSFVESWFEALRKVMREPVP